MLSVRTNGPGTAPAPGAKIAPISSAPAVAGVPGAVAGGQQAALGGSSAPAPGELSTGEGARGGSTRSAFKFPGKKQGAGAPAAPLVRPHAGCLRVARVEQGGGQRREGIQQLAGREYSSWPSRGATLGTSRC